MAEIKNIAASVHQRLINLARERNEEFNLTLTRYGLERLLYRLSLSRHCEVFVLKGALLFELWTKQRYRPTRDADFLAHGDNAPERFAAIFQDVCKTLVDIEDGCQFDSESIAAERTKDGEEYEGVRVTFMGYLGNAKLPIQIDIGFGDAVTPGPQVAEYPAMLEMPRPKLLTYPMVTSIAEKFEAMVKLGIANSRMKDLYDIRALSQDFQFDGATLRNAIANTFNRRGTPLPQPGHEPVVFTAGFFNDDGKQKQWNAFVDKNTIYVERVGLEAVTSALKKFLMPVVIAIGSGTDFSMTWEPSGSWRTNTGG